MVSGVVMPAKLINACAYAGAVGSCMKYA